MAEPGFLGRGVRGLLSAALLAEERCPGCGRVTAAGGQALCPDCLAALAGPGAASGPRCLSCGEPLPGDAPCARCLEKPRPWSLLLAYGPYDGPLRELILAYKFQGRLDLGRRLQECALAAFEAGAEQSPELATVSAIVPVPLHPRRLLARGFNQSRELARLLASRRGLPLLSGAIRRVRRTTPQMELAREARAENIRGAFAVDAARVAGAHLLLVDDIATTGATLEECARTLLAAGAARVDALVLARA